MSFVNLNGTFQEGNSLSLNVANSALRYGFGLFETMFVEAGHIFLATYHWERLFEGLEKLDFAIPDFFTRDYLEAEVLKTVRRNGLERLCRVRLQVFTEMNGVFSQEKKQPHFLVECFALEPAVYEWNENGWICGLAEGLYKSNDRYSNLKTCSSLLYVLAAQQSKKNKWNDALIVNSNNTIIESTIANIFWVKDGRLYTPPLSDGCIAGVMRRHLICESKHHHIPVIEAPLDLASLFSADEVFLTNAIRRIKWVKEIGEKSYSSPSISRGIYDGLFRSWK